MEEDECGKCWLEVTHRALGTSAMPTTSNPSHELSCDTVTAAPKYYAAQKRKGEYRTTDQIYGFMGELVHTGEERPILL